MRFSDIASFYKEYYEHVFNVAFFLTNDVASAEDLVMDAFYKLLSQPQGRLQKILNPKSYLTTIVRNQYFNTHNRRVNYESKLDTIRYRNSLVRNLSWHEIINAQLDLDKLLSFLPENQRQVFELHLEGYQHKEIAEILGITEGTSKNYLHKAKKTLREMLSPPDPDGGGNGGNPNPNKLDKNNKKDQSDQSDFDKGSIDDPELVLNYLLWLEAFEEYLNRRDQEKEKFKRYPISFEADVIDHSILGLRHKDFKPDNIINNYGDEIFVSLNSLNESILVAQEKSKQQREILIDDGSTIPIIASTFGGTGVGVFARLKENVEWGLKPEKEFKFLSFTHSHTDHFNGIQGHVDYGRNNKLSRWIDVLKSIEDWRYSDGRNVTLWNRLIKSCFEKQKALDIFNFLERHTFDNYWFGIKRKKRINQRLDYLCYLDKNSLSNINTIFLQYTTKHKWSMPLQTDSIYLYGVYGLVEKVFDQFMGHVPEQRIKRKTRMEVNRKNIIYDDLDIHKYKDVQSLIFEVISLFDKLELDNNHISSDVFVYNSIKKRKSKAPIFMIPFPLQEQYVRNNKENKVLNLWNVDDVFRKRHLTFIKKEKNIPHAANRMLEKIKLVPKHWQSIIRPKEKLSEQLHCCIMETSFIQPLEIKEHDPLISISDILNRNNNCQKDQKPELRQRQDDLILNYSMDFDYV